MLENILQKIDNEQDLAKKDLVFLLVLERQEDLEALFHRADLYRKKKYVGEKVHLRGLIEFSNYCRKNCFYCGIRRGNLKV